MDIISGIVLYNPNIIRLRENLQSIYDQVDYLILVDNGSQNIIEIEKILCEYERIKLIKNEYNKGIATALKQIMNYSIEKNAKWVLTLDQDSVCDNNLIETYKNYYHKDKIGILTCNIIDRNFTEKNELNNEFRFVDICITSGSLMNVEAYKKCRGFDDKMFIDKVDFDICLSIREIGYKIMKVNYNGLLHEVGNGRNVKMLFKDYIVYNHSHIRRYYMARNGIYLAKKHKKYIKLPRALVKEIRDITLVVLYEDNKIKKFRYAMKGLIDGFFIKVSN